VAATLAACALLALALPAAAGAAGVKVSRGVVYGTGAVGAPKAGKASLLMDIYRPDAADSRRRPAVVLVHGGGFVSGRRTDVAGYASALAARGVIAASIDYRLEGQAPVPSKAFMQLATAMKDANLGPAYPDAPAVAAAVQDALTAVDYLRHNASKLRIRTSRLGLLGSSAGAVTVDSVAYTAPGYGIRVPRLRFVASLWGGMIVPAPGGRPAITGLRRGAPPLFLVHGDADKTVPVALSDAMYARARDQRVAAEYYRIAGAGHGWSASRIYTQRTPGGQTVFDRMVDYAVGRLR